MEEKSIKDVPYLVHEGITTKLERTIEKLWILCIILVLLLVGSNGAWIYYESQFEDTVTTIDAEQDGAGINIVNGGDYYGSEGQSDHEKAEP